MDTESLQKDVRAPQWTQAATIVSSDGVEVASLRPIRNARKACDWFGIGGLFCGRYWLVVRVPAILLLVKFAKDFVGMTGPPPT